MTAETLDAANQLQRTPDQVKAETRQNAELAISTWSATLGQPKEPITGQRRRLLQLTYGSITLDAIVGTGPDGRDETLTVVGKDSNDEFGGIVGHLSPYALVPQYEYEDPNGQKFGLDAINAIMQLHRQITAVNPQA